MSLPNEIGDEMRRVTSALLGALAATAVWLSVAATDAEPEVVVADPVVAEVVELPAELTPELDPVVEAEVTPEPEPEVVEVVTPDPVEPTEARPTCSLDADVVTDCEWPVCDPGWFLAEDFTCVPPGFYDDMPEEDEPGWDWRVHGNRTAGGVLSLPDGEVLDVLVTANDDGTYTVTPR